MAVGNKLPKEANILDYTLVLICVAIWAGSFAAMKAQAVIPSKRNRKVFIPHDGEIYKHRNRIERCFNRLKHFRRFATRYDRRTINFAGFVHLAAIMVWLR